MWVRNRYRFLNTITDMNDISSTIHKHFSDFAIYKDKSIDDLFAGRNLPLFVRDYILNRFSDGNKRDDDAIRKYLETKMRTDLSDWISRKIMDTKPVNITTRIIVKTNLVEKEVQFMLPDAYLGADNRSIKMCIQQDVLEQNPNDLDDGEHWGNITIQYIPKEGKTPAKIMMTNFKSFNPYKNIDFNDFIARRSQLSINEWIDVLLTSMGYNPVAFADQEAKFTMISRLIPAIEPNVNFIELGPKMTGKSYVYGRISKHFRLMSGNVTRAQLIENHLTKDKGPIFFKDVIIIDEAKKFTCDTPELTRILKHYLEDGIIRLLGESPCQCGFGFIGNLDCDETLHPIYDKYYKEIPKAFNDSAMLDRFHMFIPGWKVGKIGVKHVYYGWAIDTEIFSEYLHYLRTETFYSKYFDELITTEDQNSNPSIRHDKAIRKITSAYCKLLFPHIKSLNELNEDELALFKELYYNYCVLPAVEGRREIYKQCQLIDSEFRRASEEIPNYILIQNESNTD